MFISVFLVIEWENAYQTLNTMFDTNNASDEEEEEEEESCWVEI